MKESVSKPQSITTLDCLRCGAVSYGLSNGPAESVRLSMWDSKYTTFCKVHMTRDVDAIREAQVDRYYYEKARVSRYTNGEAV